MGCCSSTNSSSSPPYDPPPTNLSPMTTPTRSDCPYQSISTLPPEQEESVKEVLSETTPTPTIQDAEDNYKLAMTWPEEETLENVVGDHSPLQAQMVNDKWEMMSEEVLLRQRSPAKFRNRPVSGQRRLISTSPGRVDHRKRRDSGEISGRRSRSPVTRVGDGGGGITNLGLTRNPSSSSRRMGKSPGRVRSEPEKYLKEEEDKLKWPPTTTTNESLENPLVSFECFIFL
ncbi:uncharacterized protein LOC124927499 [Impatiens glandulifera]|uniref:uncharacterized protein LOC124927499 n=1 Tax=Impatiens glandulifera TaxID=253017 RepID=UPI001FB0CAC3|nr:uncharacterized protein LOC124927499 [Impatiens glandulifera]